MGGSIPSYTQLVTDVIREASGPITLDEAMRLVNERRPIITANPKRTIRNAITNSDLVAAVAHGVYDFIPRAAVGSSFRIGLENLLEGTRLLVVPNEVISCFEAATIESPRRKSLVIVTLPDGTRHELAILGGNLSIGPSGPIELPEAIQSWLAEQQRRGCDALVLRYTDGETRNFSLEGIRQATIDPAALAARDEEVLAIARDLAKGGRIFTPTFLQGLIVRGAYRGEPQPDPLPHLLYEIDGRFVCSYSDITFRADLTPPLRRLFADRLRAEQESISLLPQALRLREISKEAELGPARIEEMEEEVEEEEEEYLPRLIPPAQHLLRLRVKLQWMPEVWRDIEMLDNQTLEELHEAIQEAFGWDRDHLYAFFISGQAWDEWTEISQAPSGWIPTDIGPPYSEEVFLSDLDLRLRQTFLYIFDFGDDLRHDITMLKRLPPVTGEFPRISGSQGEAPEQYPGWEGEDEVEWEEEAPGENSGEAEGKEG